MQIAHHHFRLDLKQLPQMLDGFDIMAIHAAIGQVADMLTEQILIALDKTEGILQIRPCGEDLLVSQFTSVNRCRYEPPCPPQKRRLPVDLMHY